MIARAARVASVVLAVAAIACNGPKDLGVDPAVPAAVKKTRAAHPELFRRKVVVLGFDSCDPDLVDQYVSEGKLQNFARLRREGAHGALATIQPILSPVVWTTIATGVPPQRHGILDFVTKVADGPVPVSSRMRQADTVWDLLSRQGETVGVVGWLVTYPAEPVNGFMVTERMGQLAFEYGQERADTAAQRTYPEGLVNEIGDEIVRAEDVAFPRVRPFLDISKDEYDKAFSKTFDPRNRVGNLRLTLATAETFRNIGERLLAEKKPRFFACYFEAMDAISHQFMPYAPPKSSQVPTDLYLKYRNAIEANYVWHDRVLGQFLDQCDADTTVFVLSDHGFKNGDFRLADSSDFHEKTGAMWHRPYGVFYAWGNGVKRGATVAGAKVYDIAPTILASMGYPVPEEMPGTPLADAFEDGLPYETVPSYYGEARREEMARRQTEEGEPKKGRTPEEEDAIRRLEALGYVGGDRSDPATTSLNLGSAFLAQGRSEMAYKEFKKVLDSDNRSPMVLDSVVAACLATNRLEEAETLIEESLQKDPSGWVPLFHRARLLFQRAKLPEAEAAARQVIERKPDAHQAHEILAAILHAAFEKADDAHDPAEKARLQPLIVEAHEASLRLEPRQAQALRDLARIRLAIPGPAETVEKARDELNRSLEMQPNAILALNNLAVAYMTLGRYAKAAGLAAEAEKDLQAALASVEKAISIHAASVGPSNLGYDKGWANKAYVLWLLGRADDAFAAGERVRKITPGYVLNPSYVAAMAASGHVFPPVTPTPPK